MATKNAVQLPFRNFAKKEILTEGKKENLYSKHFRIGARGDCFKPRGLLSYYMLNKVRSSNYFYIPQPNGFPITI